MVFLIAAHYSYFSQIENIFDHCHFHHEAFPVMELDEIMVECLLTSLPYTSSTQWRGWQKHIIGTQEKTRVVGCKATLCILTWAYIPIRHPWQFLCWKPSPRPCFMCLHSVLWLLQVSQLIFFFSSEWLHLQLTIFFFTNVSQILRLFLLLIYVFVCTGAWIPCPMNIKHLPILNYVLNCPHF